MMYPLLSLSLLVVIIVGSIATQSGPTTVEIDHTNPLIYYHGRWDASPGTWWAGSGFKLRVRDLRSLTLNLGPHTTTPFAAIGVSVDYRDFVTFNVSAGANPIPLLGQSLSTKIGTTSVVRINVEGWQNNRINLLTITLNADSQLLPYNPSKIAFQFIGDSLSAGQFLPKGVDQAWPFLVGEHFGAEHRINAQPGAALTDIFSFGNVHGVSYQFFRTEDTGFYYTTDHNFTTPWDFSRDQPPASHIVIHIGANDASQGISNAEFVKVYSDFLTRIRNIYQHQPIFIFTPWGWPNADGTISQYYEGQYQMIVDKRVEGGDKDVFLVDTTGWVTFADVFPDNQHPNVPGHAKIAAKFEAWLKTWGLEEPSRQSDTVN